MGEPFVRYIVKGPAVRWWSNYAAPFLKPKGWHITKCSSFSYEQSYGFNPAVCRTARQIQRMQSCLDRATAIVEYHGVPPADSVLLSFKSPQFTLIDDLLMFMSLYLGVYCQYLCRETAGEKQFAVQVNYGKNQRIGGREADRDVKALDFFERALGKVHALNDEQYSLAIRWFFTALGESEAGRPFARPLVETGLLWVTMEAQAKCLGKPGNKFEKVQHLLTDQGFSPIPQLHNLYALRNDAFHEGHLSNLNNADASKALDAGRALVRAQILNLLGMQHSDFSPDFVKLYAT